MKGLSLFANVGIAETYLSDVGIHFVVANELLEERARFHQHLYPHVKVVQGDITEEEIFNKIIDESKILKVDFILATPPCQGMSIAGKMKENDPRNLLIVKAMDAFTKILPKAMLIENVPTMLKTNIFINGFKIKIVDFIKNVAHAYGYHCKFDIFDVADYGTPQHRRRAFVRIFAPNVQWNDPIKEKRISVREAIGDLPSLEAGESSSIKWHYAKKHSDKHILWMKHTPTGKSAFLNEVHFPNVNGRRINGFSSTYKRMNWHSPAPTITMGNGSISSQNNVHPGRKLDGGLYSDARVLTVLELLRLTGLPDNWNIPPWCKENTIRHVIGESIPPLLVKAICKNLIVTPKRGRPRKHPIARKGYQTKKSKILQQLFLW